jgi:glycine/D-amino acid oxidase-like deaminating enzyme
MAGPKKEYDVIVIGGGVNGLATAAYLQKAVRIRPRPGLLGEESLAEGSGRHRAACEGPAELGRLRAAEPPPPGRCPA